MSIQVVRAVQEIRKEKVGGNDGKHDLRQKRIKETKWRKKGEQNTHLQSTRKATNGETKSEKKCKEPWQSKVESEKSTVIIVSFLSESSLGKYASEIVEQSQQVGRNRYRGYIHGKLWNIVYVIISCRAALPTWRHCLYIAGTLLHDAGYVSVSILSQVGPAASYHRYRCAMPKTLESWKPNETVPFSTHNLDPSTMLWIFTTNHSWSEKS